MTRRAFDPERPIAGPLPSLAPLGQSGVWGVSELLRFELAAAEGLQPPTRFGAAVRADALLEAPWVLDSLVRSGCDELHLDCDSLGPAGDPRAAQLGRLVAEVKARGLRVHARFTLGRDHDDLGCFERLVEWIEDQRLASADLRLWTPEPGSDEVRALARADRVRHRDFPRWDGAHVVIRPAKMSAQALYRGWAWARQRLASPASIWRRRPEARAEVPSYLLAVALGLLAPLRARARTRQRLLPALGGGAPLVPSL